MPSRPRLLAWLGLAAMAAGCSLTTELTGFSGGGGDAKPGEDGGTVASSDGGVTTDAGTSDAAAPETGLPDAGSAYVFIDDFNRADDFLGLGNDWQEKVVAFGISNNTAVRVQRQNGDNYRNNVAARPASEALLDVDVSMKFRFIAAGGGWVQLHARVQTATLSSNNVLDSYIFFRNLDVNDNRTFTIARQHGTSYWVGLANVTTSSDIQQGGLYRMRLVVKGTSPVQLTGIVETSAATTSFKEIARVSVADTDPTRIIDAGVVAVSSGNDPSGTYAIDDFEARGL